MTRHIAIMGDAMIDLATIAPSRPHDGPIGNSRLAGLPTARAARHHGRSLRLLRASSLGSPDIRRFSARISSPTDSEVIVPISAGAARFGVLDGISELAGRVVVEPSTTGAEHGAIDMIRRWRWMDDPEQQ